MLVEAIFIFRSAVPHGVIQAVVKAIRVLTALRMLPAPGQVKMVSYVAPICDRKTMLL